MGLYKINRTLSDDGVYQYTTDSGVKYLAKISESSPSSGLWTLNFVLIEGSPSIREVFTTMNTLTEASMEYLDSVGAKTAIFFIDGNNSDEIDQKTRIFTRWISQYWDYDIISNPEIVIPGKRDGKITIQTNAISMKRKSNVITSSNFCQNCGNPNTGSKFCPNCGTNLQGA